MYRFLLLALLFVGAGLGRPALAQTDSGLPARPVPFTFVTDKAGLLQGGEAKKLENGLRSYAEKTGTQVVVVTVPSLGGRSVADYGRALGTAWGVGQRDKNNGVVVLISSQEHKVTIQPGSGLASVVTPAVTSRIINEMTPSFKQGNYFAGLRNGLDELLATANPSSDMRKKTAATAATSTGAAAAATSGELTDNTSRTASAMQSQTSDPASSQQSDVSAPAAASSGPGMGTLLIGALIIGGILWFIIRMFKGRSAAAQQGGSPNFYPNGGNGPRPNQPNQPNFYPNQGGNPGPGYGGGGYPNQGNSGGSGMGGILATGAAAAAGAYLGNRLGGSHDSGASAPQHFDTGSVGNAGAGAAGTGAAGDYFAGRDGGTSNDDSFSSNNDYFSDNNASSDNSGDYFSSDSSSYDDTSSGDTGGGGFDSTDDNSGSW
jgi:uncharacterized protein